MTAPHDPFAPRGGEPSPSGVDHGSAADRGEPASGRGWGSAPSAASGGPYGRPARRNGLGVAALVLGILALLTSITVVGGIVLGLVALVLGLVGRGRAKRGEADNGGMALAGTILGALAILISIALIAAGVAFFNNKGGRDLVDCLQKAGNDQAAVDACQREFQNKLGG